jgi:peptidoglycan hydrolase-like protein with peptidoglycan-binding domain
MPATLRSAFLALLLLALGLWLAPSGAAHAQTPAAGRSYVQIEARRDAAAALARGAEWGQALPGVGVFALPNGWHAIALGPYPDEAAARAALRELRASRRIPGDSYVAAAADYVRRLDPSGSGAPPPAAAPPPVAVAPEPVESLAQARAAETRLSRDERQDIQRALTWFGHYEGGIDAAFGPGTRRAIASWQAGAGVARTGVLRRAERATLLAAWQAERDRLGLEEVTEVAAGLRLTLPLGLVRRIGAEPPFIRYEGPDGVTVLLLSQPGDSLTLQAFFDIFQDLAVLPPDGPRTIGENAFRIEGRDGEMAAIAHAEIAGDWVKGYVVAWPRRLDSAMARVTPAMRASFVTLDDSGLPRAAGPAPGDDLLAGMALRQPLRTASGVYVTPEGAVLTLAEAVAGCARVTVDHDVPAEIAVRSGALALLRPATALAPMAVAEPGPGVANGTMLTAAGYPFGGRLGGASVNAGPLRAAAAPGAPGRMLVAVEAMPGEAGAPLLAPDGRLAGLLAPVDGPRTLPPGVSLAVPAEAVAAGLADAGIARPAAETGTRADLDASSLAARARAMAVLVSCWD